MVVEATIGAVLLIKIIASIIGAATGGVIVGAGGVKIYDHVHDKKKNTAEQAKAVELTEKLTKNIIERVSYTDKVIGDNLINCEKIEQTILDTIQHTDTAATTLTFETTKLTNENNRLKQTIEELRNSVAERDKKLDDLSKKLTDTNLKLNETTEALVELQQKLISNNQKLSTALGDLTKRDNELKSLTEKFTNLNNNLYSLNSKNAEDAQKISSLTKEKLQLIAQVNQITNKYKQALKTIDEQEDIINADEKQIKILMQSNKQNQGQPSVQNSSNQLNFFGNKI